MYSLAQPRTQRKPRSKPERSATLGTMTNGKLVLWLTQAGKTNGYVLTPLPCDIGGVAFRLGKATEDGCSDEYDVLLAGQKSQCECLGFLKHGHCKHLESLNALVKSGKLETPAKPEPTEKPMQTKQEITGALIGELLKMRTGEVRHVNGHRCERLASAVQVDDAYAISPRQLAELLSQSEPCQRPAPAARDEFESLL